MMYQPIKGVITPTVTPFDDTGAVNADAIQPLVEYLIGHGIKGIYPLGTTGEGALLSIEERKLVAEATVKAVDGGTASSWPDFQDWYLELTDPNDSDGDGFPNLSDSESSTANFLANSGNELGGGGESWRGLVHFLRQTPIGFIIRITDGYTS